MRNICIAITAILLLGCASTGGGTGGLSLMEAIEQSAQRIAAELPAGSRVAIIAFESGNDNLSDFIMEELTGGLFDRKIEVADRQNLEYVYRELGFQMSDDVSDKSAQSIGKFLGAQLVITGQLTDIGATYRLRFNAIHVENAVRASVPRYDVRNDRAMQSMVTSLARQTTTTKTAKYGVTEQTKPQTAGTFLDRGILFASRGNYEMAITDFTEALKIDPALSAAYQLRGRALFASVSQVTSVGENFSSVGFMSTGGQVSAEQAQVYDAAIADFTSALRLDPDNAGIYRERGSAYSSNGDPDRAIADYTQALGLNPNFALAYIARGIAYKNKRDYDRAITDYDQAIRLDPNYAAAYNNRGIAYRNKNDYDRAIADYDQTLRLNPNFADAYNNRGIAYYYKRDYDRAITDYDQAIRLNPNYADAYNNRGYAYYLKNDFDHAIADYEAALQIDPNHANARGNLELARQKRGR